MQRRKIGRDIAAEGDVFAERAGVFLMDVNQEAGDPVRREVIVDVAVAGKPLQAREDALVIFLDFMTFSGDAQNFHGRDFLFGAFGARPQRFVNRIAVAGNGFRTLQGTAQRENFLV